MLPRAHERRSISVKSSGYRSDAETAFQLVFWQRNRSIARDAMDIGRGECSQIFSNSKSSNAVPPRLSIFRIYHLLPPLPLWRLLSKTISNAKCSFSIHRSARLPSNERCQRWSCHLDFSVSKALQDTLSKYHFHIFRKKTARCLRKSTHLAIKHRSL